jgi:hypothetical protein
MSSGRMDDTLQIIGWVLVLLVTILAGAAGVAALRRWAHRGDEGSPIGFTLSDLRQLHKSGQLSAEEYERAKAVVLEAAKAAAARQEQEQAAKRQQGRGGRPDRLGR